MKTEDLESLKKDELKDLLRDMGMPTSGSKSDLISRIAAGDIDWDSAKAYNKSRGNGSKEFAEQTAALQARHGLVVDGKMGPNTLVVSRMERWPEACIEPPKPLDKKKLLYAIQKFEGRFDSANKDGEFRGLFGKDHWAYQTRHIGLSFGFIQFTQDGGSLGELMAYTYRKYPRLVEACFEGLPLNDLLKMLTSPRGAIKDGRSLRVQKLAGEDIWEGKWLGAFYRLGKTPEFQDCQVHMAAEKYLNPALKTCRDLGLYNERSIVMCLDRSIQMGPSRARTLFSKYRGDENEHQFLKKLYDAWANVRWGHRPKKLFLDPSFHDGPMSWD